MNSTIVAWNADALLDVGPPERAASAAERELHEAEHARVDERATARIQKPAGRDVVAHGAYNTSHDFRAGRTRTHPRPGHGTPPPELVAVAAALGRVLAETSDRAVRRPAHRQLRRRRLRRRQRRHSRATARASSTVVADLPAGSVFDGVLRAGADAAHHDGRAHARRRRHRLSAGDRRARRRARARSAPLDKGANVRMRGEDVERAPSSSRRACVLRPQEIGRHHLARHLPGRRAPAAARGAAVHRRRGRRARHAADSPGRSTTPTASRCTAPIARSAAATSSTSASCPTSATCCARGCCEAAAVADVVITSGGVSVGVYDLVKDVLDEVGGIDFWQVAMQPGRPLAVGRIGRAHFFGLPGNPVASMLTFMLFVRPALYKLRGPARGSSPRRGRRAPTQPMRKKTGRREFKRGVLRFADGGWEVRTTGPQGSGILSSMVAGNCLIVLDEDARRRRRRRARHRGAVLRRHARRRPHRHARDRRASCSVHAAAPPAAPALRRPAARGHRRQVRRGRERRQPSRRVTTTPSPLGVRVLAGDRMVAPGLRRAHARRRRRRRPRAHPRARRSSSAYRRAYVNGEMKADARGKFGTPRRVARRHAAAPGRRPPGRRARGLPRRSAHDGPRRDGALHDRRLAAGRRRSIRASATTTSPPSRQLSRELFVSTEGALIDQSLRAHAGHLLVVAVAAARARSSTTSSATSAAGRSSPTAWTSR